MKPKKKKFRYDLAVFFTGGTLLLAASVLLLKPEISLDSVSEFIPFSKVSPGILKGRWISRFPEGEVAFQFDGETYLLIFTRNGEGQYRNYSSGNVTEKDGLLLLKPSDDSSLPDSDSGLRFFNWSMIGFYIEPERKDKKLIWHKGPLDLDLPEELVSGPYPIDAEEFARDLGVENPVFKMAGADTIIWEPVD